MVVQYTPNTYLNAYLRFLALGEAHAKAHPQDQIDPDERVLLEKVVLEWAQGRPMTVRSAIAQPLLGSPATLHKRLSHLRDCDFLLVQDVASDRRVKLLVPASRGMAYFERMGRHLISARSQAGRPLTW